MINRELLEHLRALNAVEVEIRHHAGPDAPRRESWERRVADLRAKLPTALLSHHDRMAKQGRESVAPVVGMSCGACHLKLPVGQLAELNQPGRIGVCPHCGVFLFNSAAEPAESQA
jgi:predicted  nucleic acid-binding Zn-ribbon protein